MKTVTVQLTEIEARQLVETLAEVNDPRLRVVERKLLSAMPGQYQEVG